MTEETANRKCVILAGGGSRRFGPGDKMLASLGGQPLLSHVISRLGGGSVDLALNTADQDTYAGFGLPLLPDRVEGRLGPLAGVLTAMRWAGEQGAESVFTAPADTPFLPEDLLDKLDRPPGPIVMASSNGQVHHVCARWSCALADDLQHALLEEGVRAVWAYMERHDHAVVNFETGGGHDPFFNINTPDDLARAEAILARRAG